METLVADNLDSLFCKYPTDKGSSHHYYTPIYEDLFRNDQSKNISLLEIGIFQGGSIAAFSDYFKHAQIVGVDINLRHCDKKILELAENNPRITLIEGDVISTKTIEKLKKQQFNYIIDDGSHLSLDMINTFNSLFYTHLKPGGVYIIEDLNEDYMKLASRFILLRGVIKLLALSRTIRHINFDKYLSRLHIKNFRINNYFKHKQYEAMNYFKSLVDKVNFCGENILGKEKINQYIEATKDIDQHSIEWIKFYRQLIIIKKRSN